MASGVQRQQRPSRAWRRAAKLAVETLDRLLAAPAHPPTGTEPPALMIVGAPRSGTTVVYQTVASHRNTVFINNLLERLPLSGVRVARWVRLDRWTPSSSTESHYGETPGIAGPSEAGPFWDHVFPRGAHHAVDPEEADPERMAWLRSTVGALVELTGKPFLSKNTWNSVRIPTLDEALPGSVFIVVERDPLYTAQSMLRGRRERFGEAPGPWSIVPREMAAMADLPPVEYVANQIVYTHRAIERARAQLGGERFFTVRYEEFCADPAGALKGLDAFCEARGIELTRTEAPEPRPLRASGKLKLPAEEVSRLRAVFDRASDLVRP